MTSVGSQIVSEVNYSLFLSFFCWKSRMINDLMNDIWRVVQLHFLFRAHKTFPISVRIMCARTLHRHDLGLNLLCLRNVWRSCLANPAILKNIYFFQSQTQLMTIKSAKNEGRDVCKKQQIWFFIFSTRWVRDFYILSVVYEQFKIDWIWCLCKVWKIIV